MDLIKWFRKMAIKKNLLFLALAALFMLTLCSREKSEKSMVDMDSIRPDGSHDEMYIFRKELEKEKRRINRYKSDKEKF